MNIKTHITTILKSISDENLNLTLDEMGISFCIDIEDQIISINLISGSPTKFLEKNLLPNIYDKLHKEFKQYTIKIHIEQQITAHKTQMPGKSLRGVKNVIAIASGKGGVGKSTVTVNLAIALAKAGAKVGILDADIYGPSIPIMLGQTNPVEFRNERYIPVHAHGVSAMSIGYLTDCNEALIWRGPMLAKSLIQMLDITEWDNLDYLFIDLPPGTGDIQLSLVQKIPLSGAVVVTTPQNVATLDAEKAIRMFNRTNIPLLGIIENMSQHICNKCGHIDNIFGGNGAIELAKRFKCKLLGQLPLNSDIRLACDQGNPTAANELDLLAIPFIKAALLTAIELSSRELNYLPKSEEV